MPQPKLSPESVSCTDWYPGTVCPVRSGVYQRRSPSSKGEEIFSFSYYNTETDTWHCGFTMWQDLGPRTPEQDAEFHGKSILLRTDFEWRGVAR